jgi:hypothetical protein
VNKQVARMLNISMQDEKILQKKMLDLEKQSLE